MGWGINESMCTVRLLASSYMRVCFKLAIRCFSLLFDSLFLITYQNESSRCGIFCHTESVTFYISDQERESVGERGGGREVGERERGGRGLNMNLHIFLGFCVCYVCVYKRSYS